MNTNRKERLIAACEYVRLIGVETPLDIVIAADVFGVPALLLVGLLEDANFVSKGTSDKFLENMAIHGKTEDDLMEHAGEALLRRILAPVARTMHHVWSQRMAATLSNYTVNADGSVTISPEQVEELLREIESDYKDLLPPQQGLSLIAAKTMLNTLELLSLSPQTGLAREPEKETA